MGQFAQVGPWMDMAWEVPQCQIQNPTGGGALPGTPLTWKQYAMASVMQREARERKGSMNPFQAAIQFLYTNDFTCGWAIHSTPFYGNTVITPRTIKIINRPAGVGIQRGHITVHNAYADEESYMIAVNPTFRPDPNVAFETFGHGDATKQWITWDDVWIASRAVGAQNTWNVCTPMYQNGAYDQIDQFSTGNLLVLRWAYRYARQHGLPICSALGAIRDAKNLNISLSTTGVDEFSGVTLQKTYHVYIAKQGWALKGKAFGPTLVIPPADVRDANRRNQNEDSRKRHKRIPPSWEYIMMEMMTIPHPTLDFARQYSSALGFTSASAALVWNRINVRARALIGQDPKPNGYMLISDLIHSDAIANGYTDITYADVNAMQNYAEDSNGCDIVCRETYRAWAEDTNYGQGWEPPSTVQSLGEAVVSNPAIRGIEHINDPRPTFIGPGTVRG